VIVLGVVVRLVEELPEVLLELVEGLPVDRIFQHLAHLQASYSNSLFHPYGR
jgi:hypothetical protein